MATPIPMDYSPAHSHRLPQTTSYSHPHAHDIVFQQMVLKTAQALPVPPSFPLATVQLSVTISGSRTAAVKGKGTVRRGGETDDEGYHADRDNASISTTQVADQSIGTTKRPLARAGLDDEARILVNAWKLQRRSEGLESAAGPDSGIRIPSAGSCSCAMERGAPVAAPRKVGEKRSNLVMEAEEEERKRAKYYTSDDGYGPRGPNSLLRRNIPSSGSLSNRRTSGRCHPDISPINSSSCSYQPSSKHVQRGNSTLDLSHLPIKLSDALQRLDVIDRTR